MSCKGQSTACPNFPPPLGSSAVPSFEVSEIVVPAATVSIAYEITDKALERLKWQGLRDWQGALAQWYDQHFPDLPLSIQAAKVAEEAGELCHAAIRLWLCAQTAGSRTNVELFKVALRDAIGDVVVAANQVAHQYGWDLGEILRETLAVLQSRTYNETHTEHE